MASAHERKPYRYVGLMGFQQWDGEVPDMVIIICKVKIFVILL